MSNRDAEVVLALGEHDAVGGYVGYGAVGDQAGDGQKNATEASSGPSTRTLALEQYLALRGLGRQEGVAALVVRPVLDHERGPEVMWALCSLRGPSDPASCRPSAFRSPHPGVGAEAAVDVSSRDEHATRRGAAWRTACGWRRASFGARTRSPAVVRGEGGEAGDAGAVALAEHAGQLFAAIEDDDGALAEAVVAVVGDGGLLVPGLCRRPSEQER